MDGVGAGADRAAGVKISVHTRAILEAFLVTFLWSTSWVLIKIGLTDLPALTFAGLRYATAFLCLLPWVLRPSYAAQCRRLTRGDWLGLLALGVLMYAVTQGAQFIGLAYLPAVTVSLLLTLTVFVVPLFGIGLLAEYPTAAQWGGVALFLVGAAVYFYPAVLPAGELTGIIVVLIGVLANALSAILGRRINRAGRIAPLIVTAASMGIGAAVLLGGGAFVQGLPHLTGTHWAIIIWLAVVNTAFAFTLWNRTLQILSALESSLINNTMLIQIAILAWVFLGETLAAPKILGLALASTGVWLAQRWRAPIA